MKAAELQPSWEKSQENWEFPSPSSAPTGQKPIRISLTPACGDLDFGIAADQIDYDELTRAEMEDDIDVPQLGLMFDEFHALEDEADAENQ